MSVQNLDMKLLWGLTLAITVVVSAPVFAGEPKEETVESTGEAAIVAGNIIAAKQKAKNFALRDAVERVAGTFVTGISESKDWIAVRDEVTAQSGGYVSGWEPVGTPVCDAATCKVTLKVTVSRGKLRDRLDKIGLLIQQQKYPRVLLMIAEQNADAPKASSWWNSGGASGGPRPQVFENALMRYLNKTFLGNNAEAGSEECKNARKAARNSCWKDLEVQRRFRFFDYSSLASHPLVAGLKGDKINDEMLAKIGGLSDAEILIYGTATAMIPKNNISRMMKSDSLVASHASGSVRLINIRTGQVMTTASGQGIGLKITAAQAGSRALEALARDLSVGIKKGLSDTWQNQNSGSWVKVEIRNVGSYGDLMKIKGLLQDGITGISSVQQREWSNKVAKLELQSTASAEDIAAELSAKKLGPYSLAVLGVTPGTLTLKLSR